MNKLSLPHKWPLENVADEEQHPVHLELPNNEGSATAAPEVSDNEAMETETQKKANMHMKASGMSRPKF